MFHVRPARRADDAALLAIDAAAWSSLSSPAPPGRREARTAFFTDDEGPEGFLVAEDEGRAVGYVAVHQDSPSLPSHAHVLTIDGLAVEPALQGRGIGVALVQAAVAWAPTLGATRLTLRVLATNPAALRLYERCGFEVEGTLRGEFVMDGRPVDDVLMALTV